MKVCELIDEGTGNWKSDIIHDVFFDEDCKAILAIPPGTQLHSDRYIWHYNKNGIFSVKSAYHLAIKNEQDEYGWLGNSSNSSNIENWKWIWDLNLPSKIKIFLWRACKNLLPTATNLKNRKILEDCFCIKCGEREESVLHNLFYCSFTRQVWALSGLPRAIYHTTEIEVYKWLQGIIKKADSKMFEKIILLCWAIWHSRNKRIFEGKHTEAVEIVAFADKYWKELHAATSVVLQPGVRSDRNSVRWEPPENDVVKINFDATVNCVDGVCGLGVIGRSSSGVCLGWLTQCVRQPLDPTSAEAKAAVLAVHLARERNWSKVIIEGDSSVVISAIKGTSDSRAGYGNIIMDIKRSSEDFEEFRVQHILREGNRVAHEVASLSKQGDYHLFDLPPLIHSVISLEKC